MNYLKKSKLKSFVFILINDFSLIAFSNAIEPLRLANRLAQKQLYSWKITSETGEKVKCSSGFYLDVDSSIHTIQNDDYLIICGGENIKKNSCQDVDHKISSTLTRNSKKADYIFANILLNPLKNMAKMINSKVKSKGQVFLSGILIDQVDSLLKSYEAHAEKKLIKIVELNMKQWACVQITYR